ncbi:hypothetical protein AB4Y45_41000 [Paraburkholderia sp. EG287A]|uniref:hypothetical protein n=1 Tax=Paraburkholderia sp. EG287A TaxID=3237012 RepID=UPI0034D26347
MAKVGNNILSGSGPIPDTADDGKFCSRIQKRNLAPNWRRPVVRADDDSFVIVRPVGNATVMPGKGLAYTTECNDRIFTACASQPVTPLTQETHSKHEATSDHQQ